MDLSIFQASCVLSGLAEKGRPRRRSAVGQPTIAIHQSACLIPHNKPEWLPSKCMPAQASWRGATTAETTTLVAACAGACRCLLLIGEGSAHRSAEQVECPERSP